MPRYFLEVAYKGKRYSGFQIQENAVTVQSEIQQAFFTFFRKPVLLTGSSRTDAGVNAYQNYFHFDWEDDFKEKDLYNLNSILPADITLKSAKLVNSDAHARFHASSRLYEYRLYKKKDPFLHELAWYFPYKFNSEVLTVAADLINGNTNFFSFSKRNTQVNTYICTIITSEWLFEEEYWTYRVEANRFLRGMVRGLVGTMMRLARNNITIAEFRALLEGRISSAADFSAPAHGLYLMCVRYPDSIFL